MPATLIVDANGTAIVVGSKIKIDATVVAINPLAGHYGELDIQFTYPGAAPQTNLPTYQGTADAGYQQNPTVGSQVGPPGIFRGSIFPVITKVSPSMVIVGS